MSRQLRILYPGAWYHVMNRGANRQSTFLKPYHRKMFIDLLRHISIVYKIEIHAYCLMGNHYHLLIRTPTANLPEAMRHLDSVYTTRLNKDLSRDGPLFRGRYKAVLVEADEYLLHVSRYIHLNPLEANLVQDLSLYHWSSYRYYVGLGATPSWLHTDFIRGYFRGDDIDSQIRSYTALGNDKKIEDFYSADKLKPILSTKRFIEELQISTSISTEITSMESGNPKWPLDDILNVVSKVTGKSHVKILSKIPGRKNIPRSLFIYLGRKIAGHKLSDIANVLSNCRYSNVSWTLTHFERKLIKNAEIVSLISICIMELRAIALLTGSKI